jgi:hypothetical protein
MLRRLPLLFLGSLCALPLSSIQADVITGAGSGGLPTVKVFSGTTSAQLGAFNAYSPAFMGGVRVAAGDVNLDGITDIITGSGPGSGAHVKAFDGDSGLELLSFFAYTPAFTGGVFVAAGDVSGDGSPEIITGADAGAGTHVKVFSGQTGAELASFNAYGPSFSGGVRVATGDVTGDSVADIITGTGPGGPPHVKVFDGVSSAEVRSFFPYPEFSAAAGVFVASGDINGDGYAEIVTGRDSGDGLVRVFSGLTGAEVLSFSAYGPSFTGGARVAVGDVDGDGSLDIVTGAGPGGAPHVKVFNGTTGAEIDSFFAYNPAFAGGVYVATDSLPIPEPAGGVLFALATAVLAHWRRG